MKSPSTFPPFSKSSQLCSELDSYDPASRDTIALPGQPSISLDDLSSTSSFLEEEFCSKDLEAIASRLWAMSTQSSANINALHRQRVKGREIVVTEEPRLHLVWIHDRIFIKPLPRYLLSHAFWNIFLSSKSARLGDRQDKIRKAAMGFLRTFYYLIRHESDFFIAQQDDLRLIPQEIKWPAFCKFTSELSKITDVDVSERYCYGELRLSRLNLYAPLFLHKAYFEQVHSQYTDYFARLYGPVLFVFAVISTFLNCMQVGLAVEQVSSKHWVALWSVSRWFSVISLFGTTLVSGCFLLLWVWMFLDEWIFAIRSRLRKRAESHHQYNC